MRKFFHVTLFLFLVVLNSNAQEEKYISLFIYNFTKYFDWPIESKTGDFLIQVLGHKSVYNELIKITAGKTVGNQHIIVKHITTPGQIQENKHILFIGHWQTRHLETILEQTTNKPTLLITESEGLINKGATINFIIHEGTIKFELNTTNATRAGLKTDPRLHKLAYSVFQ